MVIVSVPILNRLPISSDIDLGTESDKQSAVPDVASSKQKDTINPTTDSQGKTAAIVSGTLIDALIGGSIGSTMDAMVQRQANRALEKNPTGQAVA